MFLSVSKVVRAGTRVVFDNENSSVENQKRGARTWFKETGRAFTLKMSASAEFVTGRYAIQIMNSLEKSKVKSKRK